MGVGEVLGVGGRGVGCDGAYEGVLVQERGGGAVDQPPPELGCGGDARASGLVILCLKRFRSPAAFLFLRAWIATPRFVHFLFFLGVLVLPPLLLYCNSRLFVFVPQPFF
jgi:hypothetical protein